MTTTRGLEELMTLLTGDFCTRLAAHAACGWPDAQSPCSVRSLGKGEQPGGTEAMKGGWKMRVFTPEQQQRLGVNKYGEHQAGHIQGILGESKKDDSKDAEVSSKKADDDEISSTDDSQDVDATVDGADDGSVLPSDDPWPWRA